MGLKKTDRSKFTQQMLDAITNPTSSYALGPFKLLSSPDFGWGNCYRASFKWLICQLLNVDFYANQGKNQAKYQETGLDPEDLVLNPLKAGMKTHAWLTALSSAIADLEPKQAVGAANEKFVEFLTKWLNKPKYQTLLVKSHSDSTMPKVIKKQSLFPYGLLTCDWNTSGPLAGHVKAYYRSASSEPGLFFDPLIGEFIEEHPNDAIADPLANYATHHTSAGDSSNRSSYTVVLLKK